MSRNKEPEKIVPYDSAEAASIQTVTGWVSRSGHFWGNDEHMARYDGCTHRRAKGPAACGQSRLSAELGAGD